MPFFQSLRVCAGVLAGGILCACTIVSPVRSSNTTIYLPTVINSVLSWRSPEHVDTLVGLRLLQDGPPTPYIALAITHSVLRTNPRIAPIDALLLADETVRAARRHDLPPEFLAATLLQESAFDPRAISSAGAAGIAQFMPSTADAVGIDPFDPHAAIGGAAKLLSSYVRAYAATYANPFTAALAAYNAGPGAVAEYHGIPPYPETREYIADIADRWAKIAADETPIARR